MSLAQRGLTGFIYTFGSSIIGKIFTFAGGVYLARLLDPSDYGLVAMLYIFFSISSFLITGGFGLALIREKDIDENDKSTVFFFNLLVAIILYAIIWVTAPLIAKFYDEPILVVLARIMGLDLIFKGFTIVQQSVLKRELKFKELSYVSIFNAVVVIATAVILAYLGYGVYALAIKFVLASLFSSILLYIINPWKPTIFFDKKSFKKLFAFGSNVMLLGFINTISREFHKIVIGKYFSTSTLGFFNQGNMLKDNLANTFTDTISTITFPMLAKLQDEKQRLKEGYVKILEVNSFVILPLITLLILTAEPFVLGFLGEKWSGTIVFLQILSVSAYVNHFHSVNLNILKVYGKGKDYVLQGIIRNSLTITGVLIGAQISVEAIAWSLVITEFLQLFVNSYYSNKYMSFKLKDQIKSILPIIVVNFFMGVLVFLVSYMKISNHFVQLATMIGVGGISYISIAHAFKIKAYVELFNLVKVRLKK